MGLQKFPSHPVAAQIPKLNLNNWNLPSPQSNLIRYPNSDRTVKSNRSIYQFLDTPSNTTAIHNSSFSNVALNQSRLLPLTTSKSNKFPASNISAFQTPFISNNPSIQNIEEEMNILKSVMEGTAFRENPPPLNVNRDLNQTAILKPLLDRSTVAERSQPNTIILENQGSKSKSEEAPKKKKKSKSSSKKKVEEEEKVEIESILKKKSKIQKNVTINLPETYGKVKLRGLLWTLVYPKLWIKEVDKKVEEKRDQVMNEMDSTGLQLMELISKLCKNAFDSVYQEKASMVLVSGEEKSILTGAKELSSKDLVKRSRIILVIKQNLSIERIIFFRTKLS